ncbi:glutathione S-transferase family protein [Aquabacterium sp.]|uniref:glutathione S-transferase family protein n=1 Tax=Aquabacterium sp. TaxID=1872578 RepID=UPI002C0DB748|nr:glutathione S-transferase [Aquabacterium sp.]HSW06339.1 glutathione S-transferase [Aquabacterium sp.]
MLTLYYAPGTCALASHIALEHAGADYAAVRVDFSRSEQRSEEYLRLNPKGRVPALVTERGILTETPAILQYIAQTHPQAKLAPLDDVFALAQMNAFNSYLCATVHVAHAHRMRGYRWADDPAAVEAMKAKVPQTVGDCFALIERDYLLGPWVLGERYSVSDIYLFTLAQWLEGDSVDVNRFPKVAEHRRRMAEHPVVDRIVSREQSAA